MDTVYGIGPSGELYHWGIKGMKWGQRRYQNKDGSLTPAGRKRYDKQVEKLKAREKEIKGRERANARQAKLDAKKAELDAREKALNDADAAKTGGAKSGKKFGFGSKKSSGDAPKSKSISDMTIDELREATNRMRAETDYINAQRNLSALNPKKVSAGEKFVKGLTDSVVPKLTNTAADLANNYIKKQLSDRLGLDKKTLDKFEEAKRNAEYWNNKNNADKNQREYEERISGKKNDGDKYEQAKKEADYWANVNKAKQQRDHYNRDVANDKDRKVKEDIDRRMNDIDNKNAQERANREAAAKAEREKVYTGTVENVGNSSKKRSKGNSNGPKKDPIIIDMEDVGDSSVNSSSITDMVPYGRAYTQYLLEDRD